MEENKMKKEQHDDLRKKVRAAYTQVPVQGIYYNSRGGMEFTYKKGDGESRRQENCGHHHP